MIELIINGVNVKHPDKFIPAENELLAYVDRGREMYGKKLYGITIHPDADDDFVNLEYDLLTPPFQRLRRITGYLVGTLDRWNNGKRAEEHDRVKHDTNTGG